MLYYDRIGVSKEIDVNNTNDSKECRICHYCSFLNKGFKFPQEVCIGYHDLLMLPMNLR